MPKRIMSKAQAQFHLQYNQGRKPAGVSDARWRAMVAQIKSESKA